MKYVVAAAALLIAAQVPAQQPNWKVTGDTAGAPAGCRVRDAVATIDLWFNAFNAADSSGLASSLAFPSIVTIGGRWAPGTIGRRFDDVHGVVAYARERRRFNERLALDSVQFVGWRGARLGFTPFYRRSAADLGSRPIAGIAKAEYWCHHGIKVLNMTPDPFRQRVAQQSEGTSADGVLVRFLANEGVLLMAGQDKVLIDALYVRYGDYAVPDERTARHLALAQPPFDSVDVVLVTHYHGDHFAPEPVARHLRFNQRAALLTSGQVIDSLRAGADLAGVDAERIVSRTMKPGTRQRDTINGIAVEVLGIPHGSRRHRHVEHAGFIVEMGGRRVLHVGDTEITEETYAPFRLDTARVDVALIPYWSLLDDDSRRVIARYIKPKYIVAMHVDAGDEAGRRIARQVESAMPGAVTFHRPLESRGW
jgi:L-ascorbate metabolism protein UlaG (beta-lactamase superfamily)